MSNKPFEVIPRLSTSAKISGVQEREHQEILDGFNELNSRNEKIKLVSADSKAEFPDAKEVFPSSAEEEDENSESACPIHIVPGDVHENNFIKKEKKVFPSSTEEEEEKSESACLILIVPGDDFIKREKKVFPSSTEEEENLESAYPIHKVPGDVLENNFIKKEKEVFPSSTEEEELESAYPIHKVPGDVLENNFIKKEKEVFPSSTEEEEELESAYPIHKVPGDVLENNFIKKEKEVVPSSNEEEEEELESAYPIHKVPGDVLENNFIKKEKKNDAQGECQIPMEEEEDVKAGGGEGACRERNLRQYASQLLERCIENWQSVSLKKKIITVFLTILILSGVVIPVLVVKLQSDQSEPVNTHAEFSTTSVTPPPPTSDEPKGEVTTQMKISCDRLTMKAETIAHTAKCNSTAKRKWKKQSCVYDKNCQKWNLTTQEDPYKNRHCCPILTMNGTSEGLLKFAPQNSSDCPSCGQE
uniref:Uncharacterized protein LOC111103896 isoform X3 n=1 Tax=Crassostrea virginica TaxID=6565 RepID=A0A8B8ASK7_CRAVI|nr:uncharacterized protein LOC111103896 isoform X3 [Crassostrea virginica]